MKERPMLFSSPMVRAILDVSVRLSELGEMKDGWLDGVGKRLPAEGIEWLISSFERHYAPDLPLPYLYPTPEGGVQAEWNVKDWSVSLEIDLIERKSTLQSLHLRTDELREYQLPLDDAQSWVTLNGELRTLDRP